MKLTFDDVLIEPRFSEIESRKDVCLGNSFEMSLPVFSANMSTVTGPEMCTAMAKAGGRGVLHRFWNIESNIEAYDSVYLAAKNCGVSFGLGGNELERVEALYDRGARLFFLDVAHGAQMAVVNQYKEAKKLIGSDTKIVVGNFASRVSISDFIYHLGFNPDIIKIGIGPGSACTTRIKTGVGYPQLSAIKEAATIKIPLIADGGLRTPGDICKAIAAGAEAVMVGGMLTGTDETPGEIVQDFKREYDPVCQVELRIPVGNKFKRYSGSASAISYESQGKTSGWRTSEGETFLVPYKGSVSGVLKDIEGGLRSALAYVGAICLNEFREKAYFIEVSSSTIHESKAHGKGEV